MIRARFSRWGPRRLTCNAGCARPAGLTRRAGTEHTVRMRHSWIRRFLCLAAAALAGGLVSGCVSFDQSQFESRIHGWVPLGTTEEKAEKIMKHHGYDCHLISQGSTLNPSGPEYLDCTREQVWSHDWSATFFITDGKVSGYGPIAVEE